MLWLGDLGERYSSSSGSPAAECIFVQFVAQNLQICYKFHPRAQDAHTLPKLEVLQ